MGEKAETPLGGNKDTSNTAKFNIKKILHTIIDILKVIKKATFWIILSYLIPIINIGIILGIENGGEINWLSIVNIVLATNACFIIGAMNCIYDSNKGRETASFLAFVGLALCVSAFGISTFQIEMKINNGIPQVLYNVSAFLSLAICLILAYVSKKDEIDKNKYINRLIEKGKNTDEAEINGQNFKL